MTKPFLLRVKLASGKDDLQLSLEAGESLFILGANGTGKSSLLMRFAQTHGSVAHRITAHRQTWMQADTIDMSPASRSQMEAQIAARETKSESRYRDPFAGHKTSITLFDIIDAENVRAREIASAVSAGELELAATIASKPSPVDAINQLFHDSSMPVSIRIGTRDQVTASKNGGPEYSVSELSDGERNALLIAGGVLTSRPGTLFLIDEPERHLHRSIIGPLISRLVQMRDDCAFVISTHDHELPSEVRNARILLVRACCLSSKDVASWDADEVCNFDQIDDSVRKDILGARRKVLFVEGDTSSLDDLLYSQVFPGVSVIPKGNCRAVEQSVVGSRSTKELHWLSAFGLIDADGLSKEEKDEKRGKGLFSLPFYSVEAIYYHPWIVRRVAGRQSEVTGDDPDLVTSSVLDLAIEEVGAHVERLSKKVAKRRVRDRVYRGLPTDDELLVRGCVTVAVDGPVIREEVEKYLRSAIDDKDWARILIVCPVRESAALRKIFSALGFVTESAYLNSVRLMLRKDPEAMSFVRGMFSGLFEEMNNS